MKFTDLGDKGAQLNIKVEAAPAGVKLAAGAAMGVLSGAGGHILGAVFGPIGSIAMAAAMAHQGATLGMKMADGIWDFFSDKLGGDDNAEEFAMAHLTASAKGLPTFDYRGKTYNVKVPQQQARAAAVEVRKVTESLTERRQQGVAEDDIEEASLASMRDFFNQPDDSIAVNRGPAVAGRNPAGIPNEIQTLVNKMYHAGKISPKELEILRDFQRKTKINVGIREADKNPYAIGMSQAMKSTGDKPPLKKSTINKAHEIARAVKKGE